MDSRLEREIIKRVQLGDVNAFEPLVTEHERLVYGLALKLLGSEADAQDAVQETFIRAYRSISTFRGESRFSVWLYRIANNICLDMLRRRRLDTVSLDAECGDGTPAVSEPQDERYLPEAEFERKELRRAVREGLMQLPEEFRQALVLRESAGQSYAEISETLGIDIGTVKSRIYRARRRLCAILAEDGNISHGTASKERKGGERT